MSSHYSARDLPCSATMSKAICDFLSDETGALISSEWAMVATVLVLSGTTIALTYSYLIEDDIDLILEIFTPPSPTP
jgi:hypothetical protein